MAMTSPLRPWLSRQLENAALALLLAVVALAPLPFGSNGPESALILSGLSGACLSSAVLALVLDPGRFPQFRAPRLIVALTCLAVFGVWGLIQMVPGLPGWLPHPLWAESVRILGTAHGATISIDPDQTWRALAKSAGYLAVGTAALLLLREAARRRQALIVLILSGGLYALYGVAVWATGDCCVAWETKSAYLGVVTGPFINRNSFATFLGLVVLVCLGHLLRDMGDLSRVFARTFVARLAARLRILLLRQWPMLASLAVAAIALLLTLSRAGITSTILGAATLVFLASQARLLGEQRRGIRNLAAFAVIAAVSLAMFGGAFFNRIADEGVEDAYRTQSWKIVVSGIEASPWLGHGFGTFPEAFPLYRDDRLPSRRYWDKAQDTYLELALDMGIPATLVLFAGFAAVAAQCWKGLSRRRRERRIFPAIGLAAMVLVGAHAIYDFSMQIPAVATTFAFIIGIALTESGVWRTHEPAQSSAT